MGVRADTSAVFAGLPPVLSPLLRLLRQREKDRESRLPAALGVFPGGHGSVRVQLHHPLKKVWLLSFSECVPRVTCAVSFNLISHPVKLGRNCTHCTDETKAKRVVLV